jgi:MFS transporter, Spinster family, sphingosine-1-phosphate transporter
MHADDEIGPAMGSAPPRWAMLTFGILFAMNLLDYVDRWVLSAVLVDVQSEFAIDDLWAGLFFTLFLVNYSAISPVMGWLGDRTRRTRLLGIGIGLWSLATVGTGLARNYNQIALARSLLGIGEATYGVLAPTILMDLFARQKRARVMSAFYLAMPIGGALGMALGAVLAKRYGWRTSFFVVGAPGLIAALAALLLPEPIRGASEGIDLARLKEHEQAGVSRAAYRDLLLNSSYTYSVFGMAMYSFAIGGLAAFLPKFLTYYRGIEKVKASSILGVVTAVAAIVGMSAGGWLADHLAKTNPRALFVVPGVAMLGSIPFVLLGLFARQPTWIFVGVFLAEALMFINTGPCNAVIANVIAPNLRATAYAVALFAVHFVMGDIWSPPLIGYMSRLFGDPETMASVLGSALSAIGAVPIPGPDPKSPSQNLLAGLLIVVPALLLSGVVLLAGARHIPREMALMLARLKASPRPAVAMEAPAH